MISTLVMQVLVFRWAPTIKLLLLLQQNCSSATVMDHHVSFHVFWWSYATPVKVEFSLKGVAIHRLRTTDLYKHLLQFRVLTSIISYTLNIFIPIISFLLIVLSPSSFFFSLWSWSTFSFLHLQLCSSLNIYIKYLSYKNVYMT